MDYCYNQSESRTGECCTNQKGYRILSALPTVCGAGAFAAFLLYRYSANHAPYSFTGIIAAGPVLALAGIVISVITRKSRKIRPVLWRSGLILCCMALLLCLCILLLMVLIASAMLRGEWL